MMIVSKRQTWWGTTRVFCQPLGSGVKMWMASFRYDEQAVAYIIHVLRNVSEPASPTYGDGDKK